MKFGDFKTQEDKVNEAARDGVCEFDLGRLVQYKLRLMLESLGVQVRRHPAKKQAKVDMLLRIQEQDPNKFREVYDKVRSYKLLQLDSDKPDQPVAEVDEELLRKIVHEEVVGSDAKSEVESAIQNAVTKVSTLLKKEAEQALAEASKTYRKLNIVQPKAKTGVRMKHTMPEEFEDILQRASLGYNLMLVGPSGCGKTFISEQVAVAMKRRFASISCSAGMSESMLIGWLLPTGASGRFEYVQSSFVDMYENGGVFLLDEVDAADPNTMVYINQAIANDHFFIPQRYKKPKVTKHKDFVLIAAGNTYGNGADMMFVGRNQLDAATLDRFRSGVIHMDYSPKVEQTLVHPDVLKWGLSIRSAIRSHKLRRVMSTRFLIDATKALEAGVWELEKVREVYFADWSDNERSKVDHDELL